MGHHRPSATGFNIRPTASRSTTPSRILTTNPGDSDEEMIDVEMKKASTAENAATASVATDVTQPQHSGLGMFANAQHILITGGNFHINNSASASALMINDLAPTSYLEENRDKFPDSVMQTDSESAESERNPLTQHSGSSLFANYQNILVTGGTFLPARGQMNTPVPQKSNPSAFTGGNFKNSLPAIPSLDEPKQEVDERVGIIATQVLITAESALKHVSNSGRKAEIREAFLDLQVVESQYTVLAGFNEVLIQSGFGYLEEIHMFCSVDIPDSPLLLIRLGKILSPYPGIIFTPSSGYKTPVFKDDGTIWDYDDLCLHHAETLCNIRIKHSKSLNTFSTTGGQPSISITESGCPERGGNDNHSGAGEDTGHGHSDDSNSDPSNPEDDPEPEDPDAGNGDLSMPSISFAAQARLFEGTSNSSSSKPFQVLEINGRLVVQTISGRLRPIRIQSKSHVEFRKLNFQSMKSASLAYEQVYVGVEIDTKDKNTEIDVLQPLKTPAFDQETKETIANKMAMSGTATASMGLLTPAPAVSFSGNRLKETSSSTEVRKYHSRITETNSDGVVSWGFSVDDTNERQTGIGFGGFRAHPSVDFEFYGENDDGPPPPPPKHFDVLVTSCWSLISGNEGYTTSGWFSLFKGLGLTGTAASKTTLYSNLCQVIVLEVPSELSQKTFHKSVSEVNQSSSETVVTRPGLYKVTSTVLFLGGQPIESGNSYGPSLRR